MNTMKKNGGFTLVELIIVIAILAILSTGAIAGYSAYIQRANDAAADAVLNDISTAAVLANAKAGAIGEITAIGAGTETVTITVTVKPATGKKLADDFDDNIKDSIAKATAVTLADDGSQCTFNLVVPSSWNSSKYAASSTVTGAKWDGSAWGPYKA